MLRRLRRNKKNYARVNCLCLKWSLKISLLFKQFCIVTQCLTKQRYISRLGYNKKSVPDLNIKSVFQYHLLLTGFVCLLQIGLVVGTAYITRGFEQYLLWF